ncbi:MAG: hypothetical protein NC827_05990 [Candidatus Omnitrophica bacterium]|nr:hypothetical protein [Candidatus Omnitrophota bacterium]
MPNVTSFSPYNGGQLYGNVWNLGFDITIYNDLDKDLEVHIGLGPYGPSYQKIGAKKSFSKRFSWSVDTGGKTSVTLTAYVKQINDTWYWSKSVTYDTSKPPPPPEVKRKITLEIDKTSIKVGETVKFFGYYYADSTPIPNNVMRLYYYPATSGTELASSVTDKNGYYEMTYTFEAKGQFTLWVCGGYDNEGNPYMSNTVQIGVEEIPPPPPPPPEKEKPPELPPSSPDKTNTYIQATVYQDTTPYLPKDVISHDFKLMFLGKLMEIGGIPDKELKVYLKNINWLKVITSHTPGAVGYFQVYSNVKEINNKLTIEVNYDSPFTINHNAIKLIETPYITKNYLASKDKYKVDLENKKITTHEARDVSLSFIIYNNDNIPDKYELPFSIQFWGDEIYNPSRYDTTLYVLTQYAPNYFDGYNITKETTIYVYEITPDGKEYYLGSTTNGYLITQIYEADKISIVKFKFVIKECIVNFRNGFSVTYPKGEVYSDWIQVEYTPPTGAKEIYKCPICGEEYSTKEELLEHIEEEEKIPEEEIPPEWLEPIIITPEKPILGLLGLGLLILLLVGRKKK